MGKLTKCSTALSALYSFDVGANVVNYFNSLSAAKESEMQFAAAHANDILQRHIVYKIITATEVFGIKMPVNEYYAGVIGTGLVCAAICGYCAFKSAAADRREKREVNELRKYYSVDQRFRSKAELNVKLPRNFL
jgi:hypothetical protein